MGYKTVLRQLWTQKSKKDKCRWKMLSLHSQPTIIYSLWKLSKCLFPTHKSHAHQLRFLTTIQTRYLIWEGLEETLDPSTRDTKDLSTGDPQTGNLEYWRLCYTTHYKNMQTVPMLHNKTHSCVLYIIAIHTKALIITDNTMFDPQSSSYIYICQSCKARLAHIKRDRSYGISIDMNFLLVAQWSAPHPSRQLI